MKKFYPYLGVLLIAIILLTYFIYPYLKPLNTNIVFKGYKETKYSRDIRSFIENKLSRKDGAIYTNYLNKENSGDETKGHYILSESQGLLMEYALMINNKDLFDKSYNIIKDYMILDNGLISWRISKDNQKNKTSALIDEVRIARSLIKGYIEFGDFRYKIDAINLSKAILKNSTYNDMVTDYNDGVNTSNILTLCYIDLEGFNLLSSVDEKWKSIYTRGNNIINSGYISKELPLFRKSFKLLDKKYSSESENELLYSLMVWENLVAAGRSPKEINNWMKEQLQKYGCLYTKYSVDKGDPVDYIESTSIYAVALRLALEGDDSDLVKKLHSSLMKYHINSGELKGGFGMEKSKEAYSFDNLEAMISLLQKYKSN